jgi:2-polyprenyl-6-hydroxyphenyl methylase/3-demethylubiquinone-9 3-methyltransferase
MPELSASNTQPSSDRTGPRTQHGSGGASRSTYDPAEVARFGRLAEEWWNPNGKMAPLHRIGPARLAYLRREVVRHFMRNERAVKVLAGLDVLDVGCGGGLVAEPLARLGGTVTAIDPAAESIAAARIHAEAQGLAIDYRAMRLEDLVADGRRFDVVTCLEVLEHIPDPAAFVRVLADALKPGGLLLMSTINRTMKAYALAIVGAEYVLRWLPAGTHQWERFITTEELLRAVNAAGLDHVGFEGLVFDPLKGQWRLGADIDVNFMAAAVKPRAD